MKKQYQPLENETFPEIEKKIAKFWEENKIFERSVEEAGNVEFAHLHAEQVEEKHLDFLNKLYNNPKVREFYSYLENQFPTKEQVLSEIQFYKKQAEFGLPRFALFEKATGSFVGTAGLSFFDPNQTDIYSGKIEISYLIEEDFWGKGYAKEAANVLISIAFNKLKLKEIYGYTLSSNVASQTVLQKMGFTFVEKSNYHPKASKTKIYENCSYKLENKKNEFIFYDGPPFANGLPHYGHLLTSFIKDIYARYQTMNGKKTERRFGWDCHGLPAEMEVEKQLGIQGRVDITKYGIEPFNEQCRTSVMKYASDWEHYIQKAGRWVNFENDYKTMDLSYMESVIWAFKQLHNKGLIYEDYRVMPYSWKAETPLSNFETRMDNSYREKTSKTVTVKFAVTSGKYAGAKLLVWTTTPWTLPSNLMIAVNSAVKYCIVKHNDEKIIVASSLVEKNFKEAEILDICEFNDSISYHIFDYKNAQFEDCRKIRETVFINGQNVPLERDADGLDSDATHILVTHNGITCATARIRQVENVIKIERVAILENFRKYGIGTLLMQKLLQHIKAEHSNSVEKIRLSSQLYIKNFYEKLGFSAYGEEYLDAEIKHIDMILNLVDIANFKEFDGSELIGASYQPLFPYFSSHANAFKVVHADFVTIEDGTGMVHIAPGFGEDDHELCKKIGVQTVCPIDEKGKFTGELYNIIESGERSQKQNILQTVPHGTHLIATERLYTKEITKDDFDLIQKLYQNSEVRKHYGKQVLTDEEIHAEIELYVALKAKFGYSRLMIFEKSTNLFIGLVGIDNVTLNSEEKQIGFTLHKEFWGKGYAVEIGQKLIETLGVNEISAYAGEENLQSHKVLEKLGFANKGKKIYERANYERVHFVLDTGILSLTGRQVFDCNDDIIKFLKKQGSWHKTEQYIHNYPHCWRTDTPLIYKAMPSWYVRVTDFKDEMVENNSGIVKEVPFTKLRLEQINESHIDLLHTLYNNPKVREFYYHMESQFPTKEQVLSEIQLYKQRAEIGLPRYALFENETGKFVGTAGLALHSAGDNPQDAVELSYLIDDKFWNKGYGSEAITVLRSIAFGRLGSKKLIACTTHDNLKSQRILTKFGFELKQAGYRSPKVGKNKDYHNQNYYELQKPQGINWVPSHVKDGIFGKWLENARDWSISRNRFWGCPVPVWKSNNPENKALYVFGSIAEMEKFFECEVKDLHRPFIDNLKCKEVVMQVDVIAEAVKLLNQHKITHFASGNFVYFSKHNAFEVRQILANCGVKITNLELHHGKESVPETGYEITRVEDVLDCWFESGSMPFASVHFPFADERFKENPENFVATAETKLPCPSNFPADFIVEYTAQTRGWFYTLMVLGTALFGREPFKNCICHGVILDESGQKLSKRLRNYPDPLEVFDTIGSDAMRYFVVSSPVVNGGDLFIPKTSQGIAEILRLIIKPIWNSYNFFAMYAHSDGITAQKSYISANTMDIYILSKLREFLEGFKHEMDSYNTQTSCKLIEDFIDVLNNWYIRRNKERFWKVEKDEDKTTAYNTLYTVILDFTTAISPILPFTSEAIFQKMN